MSRGFLGGEAISCSSAMSRIARKVKVIEFGEEDRRGQGVEATNVPHPSSESYNSLSRSQSSVLRYI
jgi:hypothetical protein